MPQSVVFWFEPPPSRTDVVRMKTPVPSRGVLILLASLFTLPFVAQAQFEWTTNNGTITITRYTGPGGDVVIPATINGMPVTRIGNVAFFICTSLTSVTIPDSVTSIGDHAFGWCISLTRVVIGARVTDIEDMAFTTPWGIAGDMLKSVYFYGAAPQNISDTAFRGNVGATVYYLPWTVGWGPTFGGRPTESWNPVDWLIAMVEGSDVAKPKPLMASLSAAQKSIERGNLAAAASQLRAFQNKVSAQVADDVLAREFIYAAQRTIESM
jgi:hypothetical protein